MKDYKKILEGVMNIINTTEKSDIGFVNICTYISENCPELKESDDERIRKALIELVKMVDKNPIHQIFGYGDIKYSDMIDWLEKQGKSALEVIDNINDKGYCCVVTPQDKSALESTKEKVDNANKVEPKDYRSVDPHFFKPADKVEPKFKVGDWFVGNSNKEIFLIKSVNSGYCILEDVKGRIYSPCLPPTEVDYHLWTIADAKDGDVLSYRDGQWIFIYKKQVDDNSFHYYSLYSTIHQDLTIDDSAFTLLIDVIVPATKAQRDLLFQKMHEAGYEWDSEKKQPRKIEQKPAENEELTEFDKAVGVSIGTWNPKSPEQIQSVKAVSKKLLKLAKKQINNEQKPWSEEDEEIRNNCIYWLEKARKYFEKDEDLIYDKKWIVKCTDWLKSLKGRVQHQNTCKSSGEHHELEEFAKIVRCNLTGISKSVQQLFEAKYLQLTGNKMYEGFKD